MGKKEGENFTSEHSDGNENKFWFEDPESSEESENSKAEDSHAKRMSELKKYLEVIANWSDLQKVGLVRPYLVEWDATSYTPRFKASTLHTFDGKGSSNQHIYYFKYQTRNVVSNNAIMVVYLSILSRGLPLNGSWSSRRALSRNGLTWKSYFWLASLKMTQKYLCQLSLPLSRRRESIKTFMERFQSMALRYPSGMTQSTLVETCRYNMQKTLLAQIGVVEYHTWKQLVLQGEKGEEIVARVKAEVKESKPGQEKSMWRAPDQKIL